jgi:hypothetical protein
MKKFFLFLSMVVCVMATTTVYAAEKIAIGNFNVAAKVDYIRFTDGNLKDADVDNGLYVGLEAYARIVDNLYLGAEAGYAQPDGKIGTLDSELTYVPVELNIKYAVEASPNLVFDIGGGGSYNYSKFKISGDGYNDSVDDWLFGGQVFADLNYKIDAFFIGINGKYQVTEDFKNYDFHCTNWRIGGQIGVSF